MSRRCDLMEAIGPMTGNNVSHSNRKTRRVFNVNLCDVTLRSDALDRNFKLRIAAKTLRTVDHKGGLDAFLLATKSHKLTTKAKGMRKAVQASMSEDARLKLRDSAHDQESALEA